MNNPYQSLIQSQTFDAIPNQVPNILTQGTKNRSTSTKPSITPPAGSAFNDGISFQDIMVNQLQQQQVVDSILNSVEPPNQSVTPTPEPTAGVEAPASIAPGSSSKQSPYIFNHKNKYGVNDKLWSIVSPILKEYNLPVTQGYRDKVKTLALIKKGKSKSAKDSQHFTGNAMDINYGSLPESKRVKLVNTFKDAGITGFGLGNNTLHVDLGKPRHWTYDLSGNWISGTPSWARGIF